MSRRTAESSKAIRVAWNKEQEIVLEGQGTREWTPQQQQDILNKGKAYDDEGFAFEGQHMKSAEKYPEYQGDPGNIQFLTKAEHLEAHNGNWRNPTNWYFNPATKDKIDFGDGKYIPCKIIRLSEPVLKLNSHIENAETEVAKTVNEGEGKKVTQSQTVLENKKEALNKTTHSKTTRSFSGTLNSAVKWVTDFSSRHPVLTKIVKGGAVVGLAVAAEAVSNRSNSSSESRSENHDYNSFNDTYENILNDDISENVHSIERSLPGEHVVKPHGQHYHTNEGLIWKEKDSFTRGGNKNE